MKSDDAPVARIALDVAQDVAAVEACGIVARDQVPHDYFIVVLEYTYVLAPFHPAVGRAEEVCADISVGLFDVEHILVDAMAQAADVVKSMIAQAVAGCFYLFKGFGILSHVVAHHKKGGLHLIMI